MNRTLSVLRDYSGKIFNFCVRERNLEGERLRANSSYCGFAIAAESKAWLLGGRGRGRLPGEAVMCWRLEKPVFFFLFFFFLTRRGCYLRMARANTAIYSLYRLLLSLTHCNWKFNPVQVASSAACFPLAEKSQIVLKFIC